MTHSSQWHSSQKMRTRLRSHSSLNRVGDNLKSSSFGMGIELMFYLLSVVVE